MEIAGNPALRTRATRMSCGLQMPIRKMTVWNALLSIR